MTLSSTISCFSFCFVGNHEYIHGGVDEWFSFLRESGITPLHNEHAIVSLNESSICISGVDDLFAEQSRYKFCCFCHGAIVSLLILVHEYVFLNM